MEGQGFVIAPGVVLGVSQPVLEFIAHRRGRLSEADVLAAFGSSRPPSPDLSLGRGKRLAVVPVTGFLSSWPTLFGTNVLDVRRRVAEAAADSDVAGIVLYVNSPGGTVAGIDEAASAVRAARRTKAVVSLVESSACSAAYWIASAAHRIVAPPSADVGSVGIYATHEDFSAAYDQLGVKVTLVASTPEKIDGHPFAPLSTSGRDQLKAQVSRHYSAFLQAVSAGRGFRAGAPAVGAYGAGRVLSPAEAIALGLLDGIGTPEAAMQTVVPRQVAEVQSLQAADLERLRLSFDGPPSIEDRIRTQRERRSLEAARGTLAGLGRGLEESRRVRASLDRDRSVEDAERLRAELDA